MKKYLIFFFINSAIFSLILIGIILDYNYSSKCIENFSTFNWSDLKNISTNSNINDAKAIPSSYINNNLCNFPNCNTFNNVENNWNKYISNININSPTITNKNNFRITTNPYNFIKYNIVSPYCCEYSRDYTSSMGCICLTPQQTNFLKYRGGNRA